MRKGKWKHFRDFKKNWFIAENEVLEVRSKAWGQHLHFGWAASVGHNLEVRKLQGPADVTWKLGSPLCRCQAKTQPSQRSGEERINHSKYGELLAVESFPQQCLPEHLNCGSFKLRVRAYSCRGLSRGEFSIDSGQRLPEFKLVDWSHEDQKRSTSSFHSPPGWSFPEELKDKYQIVMCVPWGGTTALLSLNYCFFKALPLFCIVSLPLRSLITETCSRANTVARLRSQNALSQKWLLLCQGEGDRG